MVQPLSRGERLKKAIAKHDIIDRGYSPDQNQFIRVREFNVTSPPIMNNTSKNIQGDSIVSPPSAPSHSKTPIT